jgi:hypothetical protein
MGRWVAMATLCVATSSFAQKAKDDDDAPIPYGDEEKEKPERSERTPKDLTGPQDDDEEADSLTHLDDPNIGIGGSVTGGLILLESSKTGVDPRFLFGVRFTWEWGRLIPDEFIRELFFADLGWNFTSTSGGTASFNTALTSHNFVLAPAFAWPFGKLPLAVYGQIGAGFNYTASVAKISNIENTIGGVKFLFQYGAGLRSRIPLTDDGSLRLELRFEVTRYLRGYINDTLFGLSAGMIF